MLIMDAIRRLNSKHEIEILLTAYVETLQFYGAENQLPPIVVGLPLGGVEDIENRLAELSGRDACEQGQYRQESRNAISREAAEIFGAACMRLQALRLQAPVLVP